MAKWTLADNVEFPYILQDYEEYYELKFQKKPILVKKLPEESVRKAGMHMPNIPKSGG